jgi:hypothetical protein
VTVRVGRVLDSANRNSADPNGRGRIAAPSTGSALIAPRKALRLLDLLEHLEDTFRRADEKALVGLAEAATLEGIPAGSGSFGHEHHLLVQRIVVSRIRIIKNRILA